MVPPGFAPADAHSFDVPRVQNCLLEFSVNTPIAIMVIIFAFTCLATMLTSKLITEIIENHSEF